MKFELTDKQTKKLKKWQEKIKNKHGKSGQCQYRFTNTGIGLHVEVYNDVSKETLDLSEYDKW